MVIRCRRISFSWGTLFKETDIFISAKELCKRALYFGKRDLYRMKDGYREVFLGHSVALQKETDTPTKEPYISATPIFPAKEPYISAKETCTK